MTKLKLARARARLAEDDGTGDVPLQVTDQEVDLTRGRKGRKKQATELKPPEPAEMEHSLLSKVLKVKGNSVW